MTKLLRSVGLLCLGLATLSAGQPCSSASLMLVYRQAPDTDTSVRTLGANISAAELTQLSSRDVVLLIDKSYSMAKVDCKPANDDPQSNLSAAAPAPAVSRWQWCQNQALDFAKQTQTAMPDGISLVLFSANSVVYDHANADSIKSVFTENKPKGSTNTNAALKNQLDQYFERRSNGEKPKPLLIAIITDGCPTEPLKLRSTIIEATQKMVTPDEISITFLQIGNDAGGEYILDALDQTLVAQNAKYDIVNVRPFTQTRRTGLARALVDVVATR